MSISFIGDKVVYVQMGCTATIGNIAYSVDDDDWVFVPNCNWLTTQDMVAIAQELESRNDSRTEK